jgi:hypothetical protein
MMYIIRYGNVSGGSHDVYIKVWQRFWFVIRRRQAWWLCPVDFPARLIMSMMQYVSKL